MAGSYDIHARQNNHFELTLTLRDSNGTIIPTDSYQARMQVRPKIRSTNVLLDLSSDTDDITFGGSNGEIKIEISSERLLKLTPMEDAVYDLVVFKPPDDTALTLLTGSFTLEAGVTTSRP